MRRCGRHLLSCPLIGQKTRIIFLGFLLTFVSIPCQGEVKVLDSSCATFNQQLNAIKNAAQLTCSDGDLNKLNDCFQAHFLRQGERMELTNEGKVQTELVSLYESYTALTLPVGPKSLKYDLVVILGSTFGNMQHRLQNVLNHFNDGLRFERIVVLGSTRKMDARMESEKILREFSEAGLMGARPQGNHPLPTTEAQAAQYIVDYSQWPLGFPAITVLDTPCPTGKKRADTADTIYTLKKQVDFLKPGSKILFVSSQPFALKQSEDIRSALKGEYNFDMMADVVLIKAHPLDQPFAYKNMNDNIARLLYQVLKNHEAGFSNSCPTLIIKSERNEL